MEPAYILWAAFGSCAISGVVPLVNAELVVGAAVLALPPQYRLPLVIVCAVGQMIAKAGIYAGSRWLPDRFIAGRAPTYDAAVAKLKRHRGIGRAVVFGSAFVGLPPFYIVSVACGALRYDATAFIVFGLLGRALRFGAVAGGVISAQSAVPLLIR
jgi:membrane protein YqaA with SNARE-associated domain